MSAATELPSGAVAAAWSWKVIQRNAPGAINAIALTVTPVRPSVGFTSGAVAVARAIVHLVGCGRVRTVARCNVRTATLEAIFEASAHCARWVGRLPRHAEARAGSTSKRQAACHEPARRALTASS